MMAVALEFGQSFSSKGLLLLLLLLSSLLLLLLLLLLLETRSKVDMFFSALIVPTLDTSLNKKLARSLS